MNEELLRGLVYNAALLLSISIIYNVFFLKYDMKSRWKSILVGISLGLLGILLIKNTVRLESGIIFDARSILVGVSAMYFGFLPTLIAAVIISLYRIIIGGDGALMGVLVTVLSAAIGLLWNRYRLNTILAKKKNILIEFYIVGFVIHVVMLACTMALPADEKFSVLSQIAAPVLLIFPIGFLLLCIVLYNGFKDIQTRVELKEGKALLESLINAIPDLIFYKDRNSVYVGCNSAFEEFSGKSEIEIVGRTDFDLFDKEDAELFRSMDTEMMKQGKPRKNEEVLKFPDDSRFVFETLKTPYYDSNGNILGLIGISRDITERRKKESKILYLTYHDALTGLYNRAFFEEELNRLDTQRQLPLSIITGDINGLKLINDAFGHAEGDKMLVEMAKILRMCSREEDIVARTGGDEFYILLPQTEVQEARAIFERINSTCEEYINKMDRESYFASIALGYATKTHAEEPIGRILRDAEEFMYRRKLFEYKSIHSSILSSIKSTMFEKSHETEEHAERLAELSKKLGQVLGLSDDKIVELELLSTLHDIGKISIDGSILTKQGALTEREWLEIKKHPEVGYRITQASQDLIHISEYILCHHERWDGKGYPQGLSAEDIPLLSRVIAVVDSYDAMTEDRVYRKAMTKAEAIREMKRCSGTQFDPKIVEIFIEKVLFEK